MDGARVRPRLLEWSSLLLWPPVCVYAAFVLLSMPGGEPIPARTAMTYGLPLGALLIVLAVHRMLAYGYWWQDETGVHRGRIAPLHVPWTEIESYVVGMPPRLPAVVRLLGKVGTEPVQRSMVAVEQHRRAAIVLRLRGGRLLPIGLTTPSMVGGPAFRARLLECLAGKEQMVSSYSDAEVRALARVRYLRVIGVG